MDDVLFQPIEINEVPIRNRICMPAMNLNYCDEYRVTDRLVEFYAERARGGVAAGIANPRPMDPPRWSATAVTSGRAAGAGEGSPVRRRTRATASARGPTTGPGPRRRPDRGRR